MQTLKAAAARSVDHGVMKRQAITRNEPPCANLSGLHTKTQADPARLDPLFNAALQLRKGTKTPKVANGSLDRLMPPERPGMNVKVQEAWP